MGVTLSSGDLTATFHPDIGMIGSSLTHRGDELLGQRKGLEAYAETGSTMGIPLLYPWANRLSAFSYEACGKHARIDEDEVRLDPNGLPIHGLLAASPDWEVLEQDDDRLSARLGFPEREAYPFPHELRMDVTLERQAMRITTSVKGNDVPISFGYHPYLTLPGVPRAEWHVELPVSEKLIADAKGIPTGETEPANEPSGPLGDRGYDDGYKGVTGPFVLSGGGRRIEVTFDEGYEYAQVYAPAGQDLICFEPMTAPTNVLVTGNCPTTDAYEAAFTISVTDS